MKSRDATLRLKRFEVAEKARKVADLESMIRDFETMVLDLDRQIATEEDRTGVKDPAHFAYSTFAKSATQRRDNLRTSVDDLKMKLDAARQEFEATEAAVRAMEEADVSREIDRNRLKSERNGAAIG
jgi:hypothetical protein